MFKSKKLLALAICGLAASQVYAAPLNDARTAGRGGTGIALGDLRSVTINPATLATADDAYFSLGINVGAFVSDPGDLIDDVDDIQDDLDSLKALIDHANPNSSADETEQAKALQKHIVNGMRKLNNQGLKAEIGGSPVVITIPTEQVKLAITAKVDARAASYFRYSEDDDNFLEDAVNNMGNVGNKLELDELKTSVDTSAVGIADIGISYAHRFDTLIGRLDFGNTVKHQRLYLIDRTLNVHQFDDDDIFDRDKHSKEKNGVNIDVGVVQHFNNSNWRVAAVAENLIERKAKLGGNSYRLAPQLTVGGAYDLGWFKFEANTELFKNNGFGAVKETQILRAGVEFGAKKIGQVRLGFVHDYKNNQADLLTVGLGLSPFDVFNIDIAGMIGKDDTLGAAVGLGLKF